MMAKRSYNWILYIFWGFGIWKRSSRFCGVFVTLQHYAIGIRIHLLLWIDQRDWSLPRSLWFGASWTSVVGLSSLDAIWSPLVDTYISSRSSVCSWANAHCSRSGGTSLSCAGTAYRTAFVSDSDERRTLMIDGFENFSIHGDWRNEWAKISMKRMCDTKCSIVNLTLSLLIASIAIDPVCCAQRETGSGPWRVNHDTPKDRWRCGDFERQQHITILSDTQQISTWKRKIWN